MICRLNKITHIQQHHVLGLCGLGARCESSLQAVAQCIPSPRGLPLVGTLPALVAAGGAPYLHLYVDRRHQDLGPIFRDKIGPVSAVFVSDPALMREAFAQEGRCPMHLLPEAWSLYNDTYGCSRGLFFMDGEEWLRYRRIMNKLLLKGDPKWIEEACRSVSADLVSAWDVLARNHAALPDLEGQLYRWSLNAIVAVLLGNKDYQRLKTELDPLLESLASVVHLIFETSVKFQVFPASLAAKFKTQSWRRFVKTVDEALRLANVLVEQLLVQSPQTDGLLARMKAEEVPTSELTRIIVDLVLAAGDTTAYTMSWILYSLAKDRTLQESLRKANFSPVALRNVIRESLRMYPVAPFLTRILPQVTMVGPYKVPAGTLMIFSIYTTGRNSKFFRNPETFWPDRWLRENSTVDMQQACIPFGFGARSCIGKRLAENQLQATIAEIVRSFDLELMNEKNVEMVLKMVAVPSESIRLKLHRI